MVNGMARRAAAGAGAMALVALTCLVPGTAFAQSPAPVEGLLGATTEVWRDDFSAPTTWQILSDDTGTTSYVDEQLSMSVIQDSGTVWDDHVLDAPQAVLRVEALVTPDGDGMGGIACGSAKGLDRWLWAGTDGSGSWLLGRLIGTRLQVTQRGDLPREVDWEHVHLVLECASSPEEGGDHAVLVANGVPLTTAFDIPVGPYGKATLLVGADTAPETVLFDDMVVSGGPAYVAPEPGTLPSPAP